MKTSVADRILERLGGFVEHLESSDKITSRFNCRKVSLDLQPQHYTPEMVKETRKLLHASQTIFAKFLGVAARTVRSWEQGINTPKDIACRFMDEIRRDPEYWVKRLSSSINPRETCESD